MATHASTLNSFNMFGLKKCSFTHTLTVAALVMCVSAIVANSKKTVQSFYLFGIKNVSATLYGNELSVHCGTRLGSTMPIKNITNVEKVEIYDCPLPDESYAVELRSLDVNISAIQELKISENKVYMVLNTKHFEELKLKKLDIISYGYPLAFREPKLELETNALDLLTELTDLTVHGINLPSLSKLTNLKSIFAVYGTVSGQKLSGCNELREFYLIGTFLENVSSYWLENCAKLEILRLELSAMHPLSQESLIHVLEGATNLKELDLTHCKLSTLPWNWLTQAQQLRRLTLRGNYLDGIVLSNIKMKSMNYLDLRDCDIKTLKGLPVSFASQLDIDLSGNKLYDVHLQTEDYGMLVKNNMTVKVTGLSSVFLNCFYCEYELLWRAVREKRLIIDVRCNEGVKLGDADLEVRDRAECETYSCKTASHCQCLRKWSPILWLDRCNTKLHTLPREPGLQKLHVAGNDIRNIYAEDLFDSLQFLDLRNNSISVVNAAAVERLFSVPERHVLLSGNQIACVCENKELFDALRANQNRVDDYNSIKCVGGELDKKAISKLHPADLCPTQLPVQQFSSVSVHLGVGAVVLTVICSSLLVLYYRHKLAIKVFLYTRGWCLCCVREEELDADRPYDAFVSFSHEDAKIIVEELVPKLENPPCSYKLCVHYRDWVPGELISEQIKTSVAQSRRTIIALSRNYMNSIWGLREFREAHINTLREGRVRVIVIILDDVLDDENLDPEWRAYLQANTYVNLCDPWFWDKVKYALPHRTNERIV